MLGRAFLFMGVLGCASHQGGLSIGGSGNIPLALSFLEEPSDTRFAHTHSTVLNCKVEDRPKATVTWRIARGGEPIKTNITGVRDILFNGSLLFPAFPENRFDPSVHAAEYQCIAQNKFGSIVSRIAKLQAVIVQPYKVYAKDTIVTPGNTAVIKSVIPREVRDYVRVVSWHDGDKLITLGGKYFLMPSGSLVITKASDADKKPLYHCITVNVLTGEKSASNPAKLYLRYSQDPEPSPPRMTSDAFNVTVYEGNTAELQCIAEGSPVPIVEEYAWKKDGVVIQMGDRFSRFAGGSLRIERTKYEDLGWYECEVKNSEGSATIVMYLTVKVPLVFTVRPRRVVAPISGFGSTMECEVRGEPKPNITWLQNGQQITGRDRFSIKPNNQLVIGVIYGSDLGAYQCIADNGLQLVQSSAELIAGERNPTVETSAQLKVLNSGERLIISCKAFSQSILLEITWYLDGKQLYDGKEYSITSASLSSGAPQPAEQGRQSKLRVDSISVEKTGRYSCVACNMGNCTTQMIQVYINGSATITKLPSEVTAIQGQGLSLPCIAKGYPVPNITWSKDGRKVPFDRRQSAQDNLLEISDVQQNDRGNYKCTADNGHLEKDEGTVLVTVLELPNPRITSDTWHEGKPGLLQCFLTTMNSNVIWMKDNKVLENSSNLDIHDLSGFMSVLTLKSLTSSDSGNYKCVESNIAGTTTVAKDMVVYVPPRFIEEPIGQQVLKSYMARLTCLVSGVPPVRIDWSKASDGKFVPVPIDKPRFEKMLNGTLVIRNVTDEDDGRYLCTAYNSVSTGTESRHVELTVHAVPATIASRPADRSAKVASDVSVTCTAIGNLPIELIWFNGTRQMSENLRISIATTVIPQKHTVNSTLVVRRLVLKDTKQYSCYVRNAFGNDEKSFKITAQQRPSPPLNPKVQERAAHSIYLKWTANFDGNAKIEKYVVEFKMQVSSWDIGVKREVDGSSTGLEVDGLKPATAYNMRVYAVNALGRGDSSVERTMTTLEAAPSEPPVLLNLTAISAREIYVSWAPPDIESQNGVIRGYFVICKQRNKYYRSSNLTVIGGETRSLNISNLEPYTDYIVELQAFTRAGVSPKSKGLNNVKTHEDVPSQPPQSITIKVLSSQSMMITWGKPPSNAINGRLQGYRVYYYSIKDPEVVFNKTVMRPHNRNVTLTRLGKFTTYKITVVAFTRKGEGVASTAISETTFEDIPGVPSDVKAIPVSKQAIRVFWGPPLEPNGIIRTYLLYYSKEINDPSITKSDKITSVRVSSNSTWKHLSSLESQTLYYFWVKASTVVGTGNASDVVNQTTREKIQANIFYEHLPVTLAKRASTAILDCEAYGYPEPSVMWYSSGRELHNTDKYNQLSNGSLEIMNVREDDAGEYECTASNKLGRKTVVRKLQVQTPPMPPASIHFLHLSLAQAVNITWSAGDSGNSPVTMFVLEYKAHGDKWEVEYIHFSLKYHVLHNIHINKDYYFRMSAVNAVGKGKPSKILQVTFRDGLPPVVRQYEEKTTESEGKGRRGFYGSPTFLGVLIGITALIFVIIVCFLLVAFRGGHIKMDKVHAWRKYWKRRILGEQVQRSQRTFNHGRSNGNQSEGSPSTNGNLADSSSSLENNRSVHGSEISLPRTNSMLRGHFTHEPILEEEYPPPPAPYSSVSPNRVGQPTAGEETLSDSSSEAGIARPVYHRPILHEADPMARARRYMEPENYTAYPNMYNVQRSLNGTPAVGMLGFRGHADGGSELDTASVSRAMESNENLRRMASAGRASKSIGQLQSQENFISQNQAATKPRPRDSGLGLSRNEIRRMSVNSRRGSSLSQVTPVSKPVQTPQRRESASSQEPSPYRTGYKRQHGSRDPRAYDSASSEYSSSRDELISALEFGKRHNLDKYYGIPTLETTSASSEATNSSEQDGICKFSASPRPLGDGCYAPTAVHQPPSFYSRSRSRGNENYFYVLDPRKRGMDRGTAAMTSLNNGSVV